ncbi:MAG: exopolyphosphatase [Rhodospirillales bacterium]|nr:exopolyphosphatase [Rhodospirillales bacterium]
MSDGKRHQPEIEGDGADAAARPGRIGVVDIGSNTVRLVVYDLPNRLPIPIFNEKSQCALGLGMGETGRLNPKGVGEAVRSLVRFVKLARAMDVGHLELVGTAAVRDASDRSDFIRHVESVCGVPVHVLSGAEEARLAAVGLVNGVPDADGVLGDLGGGSLDLVGLADGEAGRYATLPLGHLRLPERAKGNIEAARAIVAADLAQVGWLDETNGRRLYAVGGSWRALARLFIEQTHHPLHVIDNFELGFFGALRLANLVAGLSQKTLAEGGSGIDQKRLETLPYAALTLAVLLERTRPARVVFSAFGMREGQMIELLPAGLREQDPLLSACESHAERTGRFAIHGQEILDWMAPLFAGETAWERRLRLAICLVSDIGWSEHPDYRAIHAFFRVLRVPYPGLTHPDRVEMALAIFVRYGGSATDPWVARHLSMLDDARTTRAQTTGLALRLAHTLSGGAPGLLRQTALATDEKRLSLRIPKDGSVFMSGAVERRLNRLARTMALKAQMVEHAEADS